jgi:hypothetical protein
MGLADATGEELVVAIGCAVGRGEVVPEDGETLQAENVSAIAMTAPLKSTR